MRRRLALLLITVLAAGHAAAAEPPPGAASAPRLHARYDAYADGFHVLQLDASFTLSSAGYTVELAFHTTGLLSAVLQSHTTSTAQGEFQDGKAVPSRFYSWGDLRGQRRITLIDYADGNPVLRELLPPPGGERDPVPADQQDGTIDTLSAMAQLIHTVSTTGRCDGAVRVFDGRRLSSLSARTAGGEVLPGSGRSSFKGPALRCDFVGQQLAGFVHDVDAATLRRPQHGVAWLARVLPGMPPVPVRVTFSTRAFGNATLYLAGPVTLE